MSVEVVTKRKGATLCGGCGEELSADAIEAGKCPSCGSTEVKKSLVIVRKAVGDEGDDLETTELDDEIVDEDEDLDDEDDETEDEDEDEDDDEDEDEEDEEDDDEETTPVKKSDVPVLGLEALNIGTAFVEDVVKVFAEGGKKSDYEDVMTEFNDVMDAAASKWFSGKTVSKKDGSGHAALIQARVNAIVKEEEGTTMTRPENLKVDDLDDDVKAYIESLEKGGVQKNDDTEDIFKGLTPAAADIVRKSQANLEAQEVKKFDDLAKSYSHFPGDKVELAKSLRKLSETDEGAFKVLKDTLDAGEENLKQSDVFKSYGSPREGTTDKISKRRADAAELVAKGDFKTIEEAEVSLMSGADYAPTAQ